MFLKYIKKCLIKTPNQNIFKNFSEKFYKLTLSGLDKFLTNDQLKAYIKQINEVEILRINKSTNKNYCHADVASSLDYDQIKSKFGGIKFLGKSVKVRVKQFDDEEKEFALKNYTNIDFSKLNNDDDGGYTEVKIFIKQFYLKNLTDNPTHIRNLLEQFDKNDNMEGAKKNLILLHECKTHFNQFEYIVNFTQIYRHTKSKQNQYTFLPVKTLASYQQDSKNIKIVEIFKLIFETFEHIFSKLSYDHYDLIKNKGTYKNLQLKFNDNVFMCTLMLSSQELTDMDIKIISEAIKYEFEILDKRFNSEEIFFINYLAINEKINSNTANSRDFIFVNGKHKSLQFNLVDVPSPIHIDIFPNSDENYYNVHEINFNEIYRVECFNQIYDISYSSISLILNVQKNQIYILKIKNNKNNFSNFLEKNQKNLKFFEKVEDLENEKENMNNLLIINLSKKSKSKIVEESLKLAKYHMIISHSLPQILDFLKIYKTNYEVLKIIFLYDLINDLKEIIFCLKISLK